MIESKKQKKIIIIIILVLGLVMLCFLYQQASSVRKSIKSYNGVVKEYNAISSEYNEAIENSCVDNIDGMPTEMGKLNLEDESILGAVKVIFSSNSKEKILKDTQTLHELIEAIYKYIQLAKQVACPEEKWIINRLGDVSYVKGTQSVTSNNDPDGLLGKVGGYKACVYFTIDGLDISKVPGKTIVEKGADAGGAIEIYETLEEAEDRCEYLSGFDGTILYSGSYAIVGTMVVRTSYMLSEEDQLILTNEIVKAFTALEEEANEVISVEKIEAYKFTSSFPVLKKVATDEVEINKICSTIREIDYEEYDWSMTPELIGPAPILFKIYLSDGTVHEVKFLTYGEKGEQITIDEKGYKYEGDFDSISELWNMLSSETEQIDRNDM